MTGGVPTLRSALRRARHAGARVEQVHATGEVRVSANGTRLTISVRRKDATRELVELVDRLERDRPPTRPPRPASTPIPRTTRTEPMSEPRPAILPLPGTGADQSKQSRVGVALRAIPPDPEGWRKWPSPSKFAADLGGGVAIADVAFFVTHGQRKRILETRRTPGNRIDAIRFLRQVPGRLPSLSAAAESLRNVGGAADSPPVDASLPPPALLGARQFLSNLPNLARYVEARKLAQGNQFLRVDLVDEERDAVLGEACRLFAWVRSSKE